MIARRMSTCVACAYFATLFNASRQQKYTADSTSCRYRSTPSGCTVTGTADFLACASSAAGSPCRRGGVDRSASKVPEVLEGLTGLPLELGQQLARLRRVAFHHRFGQAQLDRERDELLLSAVMDVPFERAGAFVLCADDPPPGLSKVLDQPNVPEHQSRLRRHVTGELLLGRVHRIVRRHGHGQCAEELTLVPHLEDGVRAEVRERRPSTGHVGRRGRACGPRRLPGASRHRSAARPARPWPRSPRRATAAIRGRTSSSE